MTSLPYLQHELRIHASALRALAVDLVGPSDADDVVQETALRALRVPAGRVARAGAFLATIVRNLASKHRREQRRRAVRERASARPEALPPADALAERLDILRRVHAAVFALPEPYQTTVLLRYFEELTPAAIAERTKTPVATVKSRLQRGLHMLRAELDRDDRSGRWCPALAAMIGEGATMRPTPRVGPWLAARAWLVAVAAALVAAMLPFLPSRPEAEPLPVIAAADPVASAGVAEAVAAPLRRAVEREAAQDAPASAPAPKLAVVRGRCVDTETGKPIAGARARLDGHPRNDIEMARHGPVEWQDPEPVLSNAEGRFEIRFEPPPPYQFGLDIAADGRAPRTGRWYGIQPGRVEDLGDIAFARGYEVRGTVVDPDGQPVAHAGVYLINLPLPIGPRMGANDTRTGFSDAEGAFRISTPIPAGTWALSADTRGLKLVRPDSVLVRKEHGAAPVTVVVRRTPSVRGIVVDETGVPLAGVVLEMRPTPPPAGAWRMATARSGKVGLFEIFAVDDEPRPASLVLSDPSLFEPWPGQDDVAWTRKDLRVVLKRALSVWVTVVEKGTNRPVETYAVRCHLADAGSGTQGTQLRAGGVHPDGMARVDGVRRGDNVLRVMPNDPALAESAEIRFTAADPAVPPLRVELERRPSLLVRVVRGDGTPVVGTTVEVIRHDDDQYVLTPWMSVPELGAINDSYSGPLALSSVRTDGAGRATVFGIADHKLVLRVRGGDHVPLIANDVTMGGTGERVLVVEEGTTIVGAVVPAEARRLKLAVTLIHAGQQQAPRALMSDGAFRFAHLSAAETTVILTAHAPENFEIGGWNAPVELCRTPVRIAGAEVKVELDASAWVPARLEGIVTLDGKAPAAARVFMIGRRGGAPWRHGPFTPDDKGRFAADAILPGSYEVQLVVGAGRGSASTTLTAADAIDVAPGASVRREFGFKTP